MSSLDSKDIEKGVEDLAYSLDRIANALETIIEYMSRPTMVWGVENDENLKKEYKTYE